MSTGGWAVGLDIGGTKVSGQLFDGDGQVRGSSRAATRPGTAGVVGTATTVVEQLCRAAGIVPTDLAVVGAGVPGVVDRQAGSVSYAVNLGIDERDVPLGPLLARRLGVPSVGLENDLNVAVLGAAELLGLGGDVAYLALGTGVAAGLLLDGRLRRGHRGAAGEVGHVPYVPDGPACPCGQRGCLELYASGAALDTRWPSRTGRPVPVEVFTAAAAGEPDAAALRASFADAVAAGVRMLVLTCDVEHVVLGGGVAELGAELLAAVVEALVRQAAGSAFLRSLRLPDAVSIVPPGVEVAPLGAVLSARAVTIVTEAVP